jgi:selenocysteine lyase/cysteine desulfurase
VWESSSFGKFLGIHRTVRARFPQIAKDIQGNPRIYLNSAAGTLAVDTAARAAAQASTWLNSLPGEIFPAEATTAQFQRAIREITADFLNAPEPDEISFHFSSTQALFNAALSMRGLIRAKNNLVVTDLDHMANISPWESVGGKWWGAHIRRARIRNTGELDTDHLLSLVDETTAVVAVTLASNALGTIVPLRTLIPEIRKKSPKCLVCVDAVHHALHGPIDVQALDCDLLVFSGYKVFGPMLGVMWGKRPLLDRMKPFRVETNKSEPPFKFEQGTLNNASLASLGAALRYIVWLADELDPQLAGEHRRSKLKRAMTAIAAYEHELSRKILVGIGNFSPGQFHLYGIAGAGEASLRDPTFAFEIPGMGARDIKRRLWEKAGIQTAEGNHYSAVFYRHFQKESVCRASFAHYNSPADADALVGALEEIIPRAESRYGGDETEP